MATEPHPDHRFPFGLVLSRVLVACLCLAALTAVVAIMSGDFDRTDGNVIATSLAFAVFAATAASGAAVRRGNRQALRVLGAATISLSVVSFLFLVLALWDEGAEETWRWFGCATLATLAGSHASLMSPFRFDQDSVIRALAAVSIALGSVDAGFGIAAISGAVDELAGPAAQLLAALVVLLVLTTVLPPILRRMHRPRGSLTGKAADHRPETLADHVLAAADRIEALTGGPANRAPDIRRECERLRALARDHAT